MKAVRVDIHDELISFSIKEGQKLNVIVVDYVSFEIKTKFEQSKVDKTYNSRYLFRVLWKSDHLGPIWINGNTNNFISFRGYSRQCKANKIPERFPNKQNIIQVLLYFKKAVYQYIVSCKHSVNIYKKYQLYQTNSLAIPTRASYSTVVSLFRVYLSSLVSMPLSVKMISPEQTHVVISSIDLFIVQTLKIVRTRYTSCSSLSRRIRLGINLIIPSQESVVLYSI